MLTVQPIHTVAGWRAGELAGQRARKCASTERPADRVEVASQEWGTKVNLMEMPASLLNEDVRLRKRGGKFGHGLPGKCETELWGAFVRVSWKTRLF